MKKQVFWRALVTAAGACAAAAPLMVLLTVVDAVSRAGWQWSAALSIDWAMLLGCLAGVVVTLLLAVRLAVSAQSRGRKADPAAVARRVRRCFRQGLAVGLMAMGLVLALFAIHRLR